MAFKQRKNERFLEAGKVFIPELCVFPGFLLDISVNGCRIRFPAFVEVDTECDYEASFALSWRSAESPLVLILQPKWKKEEASGTEIGFEVLHSPGTKSLVSYIAQRMQEELLGDAASKYASCFV